MLARRPRHAKTWKESWFRISFIDETLASFSFARMVTDVHQEKEIMERDCEGN